jgi:ribose 5-phosphate isomerase B
MTEQWRIVVGADEAGVALKDQLAEYLKQDPRVSAVEDLGVYSDSDKRPYSDVGLAAGAVIADGQADRGLLICGTGIGIAIAAGKVPGIRATVAHDGYSVQRSVLSNNCQVLTFGARVIAPELAKYLVDGWLDLRFDESSPSAAKVAVITEYERARPATD